MSVTNADNQELRLKKKVGKYYVASQPYLEDGFCPIRNLLASALDKWSMLCLFNLGYYKVLRFNELKKNVTGISARMLSVTMKKLEEQEIVVRKVYAEVPPRVEYSLTPFGQELSEKLVDLGNWYLELYTQKED